MTNPTPTGNCLCGSVHVDVTGEPNFAVICHCTDCQKISGGGPFSQAAFPQSKLHITGQTKTYEWLSDDGNSVSVVCCDKCFSPVGKATSKLPDVLLVARSLLSDQSVFDTAILAYAEPHGTNG